MHARFTFLLFEGFFPPPAPAVQGKLSVSSPAPPLGSRLLEGPEGAGEAEARLGLEGVPVEVVLEVEVEEEALVEE